MNKLLAGVFALVAVLGTGMIFLQQQNLTELRAEVAGLRTDLQQLAKSQAASAARTAPPPAQVAVVTTEAGAVDEQRAELAKLREEMAALKKTTQEATRQAQAATQAARGESPIPVKLTPAGELKNVGRATASAAVETILSAAYGGDVDTLASSIVLDGAALAKAEELFARLPEATRAQYGSPEKLVALMLAKDATGFTGMQILGQRDMSADVVGVRVRFANEEGKTKEQGLAFRKTSDGLRLIVPEDAVKKYAGQLSGGK